MPDELTRLENESIRKFVQQAADDGYLSGRVLDYGAGKSPYRDVVEAAGGTYYAYDMKSYPANDSGGDLGDYMDVFFPEEEFDTILMNQTIQYIPLGRHEGQDKCLPFLFSTFRGFTLSMEGHLVMTGPCNWPEVQDVDLHRFTKAGIAKLLSQTGFKIVRLEDRAGFEALGYHFSLGWGVIARA